MLLRIPNAQTLKTQNRKARLKLSAVKLYVSHGCILDSASLKSTHRKAVHINGYAIEPATVERKDPEIVFTIMNCDKCVYFYTI